MTACSAGTGQAQTTTAGSIAPGEPRIHPVARLAFVGDVMLGRHVAPGDELLIAELGAGDSGVDGRPGNLEQLGEFAGGALAELVHVNEVRLLLRVSFGCLQRNRPFAFATAILPSCARMRLDSHWTRWDGGRLSQPCPNYCGYWR